MSRNQFGKSMLSSAALTVAVPSSNVTRGPMDGAVDQLGFPGTEFYLIFVCFSLFLLLLLSPRRSLS